MRLSIVENVCTPSDIVLGRDGETESGVKTSPGIGGNTRVENEGGVKGERGGGSKMAKNGKFSE